MKIRNNLVSNSSSSSFICVNIPPHLESVKLNRHETRLVLESLCNEVRTPAALRELQHLLQDQTTDLYLTAYLSDSSPDDYGYQGDYYSYHDGGHGGPYFKFRLVQLHDTEGFKNVWLKAEHSNVRTGSLDNHDQQCPTCNQGLRSIQDYIGAGSHYWVLTCNKCDKRFTYDTHCFELKEWYY